MEKESYIKDFEEIYQADIEWELIDGKAFLITGATGMLASYFVYYLCFLNEYKGFHIKIVAQGRNKEKAYDRFFDILEKEYFEFRDDSILFPLKNFPKCDFIIHAASLASPQYYASIPIEVAEPNTIGTYHLLNYAAKSGCDSFLYFSSGDVYGKISNVENITEEDMGSVDPLDIHSCYSESKRMGETWCKLFAEEKKVHTVIARIGHTYGPTMNIEEDPRVFASFMKSLVYKEDICMHSDGTAKRPFCYISDAVTAFFLLLLKGEKGEAYNVCNTKQFYSMNELAEIILGLRPEYGLNIIHEKKYVVVGYVENKDNKENKTVEWKIEQLGWKPKISAKEGFRRVLRSLEWKR